MAQLQQSDNQYELPLEEVLNIYKFKFYYDEEHFNFVKYIRSQQLRENRMGNRPSSELPQIYIPSTQTGSTRTILSAIKHRIPVYFGAEREDLFSWEKTTNILKYSKSDIMDRYQDISNTRYAIGGPVKYIGDTNRRNLRSNPSDEKTMHMLHIWGVNLESRTTPDYLMMSQQLSENNFYPYYGRQYELFNTIISASIDMASKNNYPEVNIQVPFIGAGCYLKALNLDQKNKCIELIIKAIMNTVCTMPNNSRFHLCVYSPDEFDSQHLLVLRNFARSCKQFVLKEGNQEGNVMNGLDNLTTNTNLGVVVNAWDTLSLIGNGGSRDYSVDGFMVANAGGFNNQFRNTSYLHNAVFNQHYFNPDSWITV